MMDSGLTQLKSIKSFPSLVKYLRDELDWPIESDDVEDITFDYEPEELGIDAKTAARIKEIKQLRPLATNQPWGIFYINFEPKRLPIVALRRILRALVIKKRASANKAQHRAWQQNDLLFISSYGETDGRELTFAHFSENAELGDLPTLKVLGWNASNTVLRLEDTYGTLKDKLRWPEDEADAEDWREQWSSAFKLQYRETVRTSKDLAVKLARLAEDIRNRVNAVLAVENERGELRKLYKAFQEALIHDLSKDDFADMYAQTIAYGLLSASISRQSGALVADNLKDMVPNTNPFLKELMQTFLTVGGRKNKIDFDELGINEVVELLRRTQMDEVLKDFGAKNPQEDPVIHFYELFLKEYDPEKRMKRGVFYTPRPVVSFIVRSVDEILRTEFGLEDGLADTTTWGEMAKHHAGLTIPQGVRADEPFVQILDPATGTGTFLVEVIDRIYGTMRAKWQRQGKSVQDMLELWNDYVPRHLLPRLHGFELMMAPYAIAHMKIGLKLRETHYSFLSSERAHIYLTNALEEPKDFSSYFEQMAPALAHEANAANRIKRYAPITVIIGNPPYSGESANKILWIEQFIKETYQHIDNIPLKEKGKKNWLLDDYVKFLRLSHLYITKTGFGLIGHIINNAFQDNPTFRGLRRRLQTDFLSIRILDLHGSGTRSDSTKGAEKDENVFDILQGVCVILLSRTPQLEQINSASRGDLWGTRETKYKLLFEKPSMSLITNHIQPQPPQWFFTSIDLTYKDEWDVFTGLLDIFPINGNGLISAKDHFAYAFSRAEFQRKLKIFLSSQLSDNQVSEQLDISNNSMWSLHEGRLRLQREINDSRHCLVAYRPFDSRHSLFHRDIIFNLRLPVTKHIIGGHNLVLLTTRMTKGAEWQHVFVTRTVSDCAYLSNQTSTNTFVFPLYKRVDEGTLFVSEKNEPNLNYEFVSGLSSKLLATKFDQELAPEDICHYVYAILNSLAYRFRYSAFLKIDFPRIPFTSDTKLFSKLCALGSDLIAFHLLEDDYEAASWNTSKPKGKSPLNTPITRFTGKGSAEVAKGYPKYKDGSVYINPTRYFEGVPEEVWHFHVGGYQVCEKWLKDRRERTLTDEDIAHYQRVVVALNETIRLMAAIDQTIEAHGGWPLVGSQDTVQSAPGGLPFA